METKPTIAICITTRNRPNELRKCIEQHEKHLPKGAVIIVVDDASEPPAYRYDCRMVERSGIPRVKNECLKLAMAYESVEHIFLFDDDTYPIKDRWQDPYIKSPYPHLCYSFTPTSVNKLPVTGHKVHRVGNGCMLYVHRSVVDRIGGFDTTFGIGKFEHNQFSMRVQASGMIPCPYIDVIGSEELIYSMDRKKEVERTMTKEEMKRQVGSRELNKHFENTTKTGLYIPFDGRFDGYNDSLRCKQKPKQAF